MKIGDFAKKYDIPISTVRYYIDEGLITPKKNGAQYDFNESNEFEMQLLNDLREATFSLEEMRQFINISRILDEKDPARYEKLKTLFREKKERLNRQILDIKDTMHAIDLKLDSLTSREAVLTTSDSIDQDTEITHGLPLSFLTHIACPDCGATLDINNATLSGSVVTSGELKCSCGYYGNIEDGIIYVDPDTDLDTDQEFCEDYFVDPSTCGNEPLFYECFFSAPPRYLSLHFEARTWINEIIHAHLPQPDMILFPDMASVFPYLYNDSEYLKNATLIITGLSRKAIIATRRHMDTLDSDLNIIYIVNPSNRLPLKRKSIDLMVDYASSYNYAFFFKNHFYDYIDPYFSDSASIASCISYYGPKSKSVLNITREYSNAMDPFITLSSYIDNLRSHGYDIKADKAIGANTVLSEYFHYHHQGEELYTHTLLATRSPAK